MTPQVEGFRKGLAETGYVVPQNLAIEYRWAEGHYDRLPALAADLVQSQVSLFVAGGGPQSALAAKAATSDIPILFEVDDPINMVCCQPQSTGWQCHGRGFQHRPCGKTVGASARTFACHRRHRISREPDSLWKRG